MLGPDSEPKNPPALGIGWKWWQLIRGALACSGSSLLQQPCPKGDHMPWLWASRNTHGFQWCLSLTLSLKSLMTSYFHPTLYREGLAFGRWARGGGQRSSQFSEDSSFLRPQEPLESPSQDTSRRQRLMKTTAAQSREHSMPLWEPWESNDSKRRTLTLSQCYQNPEGLRPPCTPSENLDPSTGVHLNNWMKELTWDSVKKGQKGNKTRMPTLTLSLKIALGFLATAIRKEKEI